MKSIVKFKLCHLRYYLQLDRTQRKALEICPPPPPTPSTFTPTRSPDNAQKPQWQGWGQIRFIKYKYKYKYIFFRSFKYKYKYKYTGKNLIKYKYKYSSSNTNTNTNTQWGRDKIAAILQMTYWNLLYCKKIVYTFKFHWKLFPKVQSTISLHWFR